MQKNYEKILNIFFKQAEHRKLEKGQDRRYSKKIKY